MLILLILIAMVRQIAGDDVKNRSNWKPSYSSELENDDVTAWGEFAFFPSLVPVLSKDSPGQCGGRTLKGCPPGYVCHPQIGFNVCVPKESAPARTTVFAPGITTPPAGQKLGALPAAQSTNTFPSMSRT